MANEVKANYGCAQKDLYSGLRLLWKNFVVDIADFFGYKNKYVEAVAEEALAAIDAAELLPDSASREANAEMLKPKVNLTAGVVVDDFKKTQGYIDELFKDEKERSAQYVLAGYNYFHDGETNEWESVKQLGVKNKKYVSDNAAALKMEGRNMPESFPGDVSTHTVAFEKAYVDYLSARETGVATATKLKANNDCYDTGRALMKDAVRGVYPRNAEMQDRYNWDRIQAMINPSVAGMDGYLKDATTNASMEGVVVELKGDGKPAVSVKSDKDGKYSATGIEAGVYSYTISKDGYKTIRGTIDVKLRTVSRKNFMMEMI